MSQGIRASVWVIVVPAIAAIVVALIQFGPAWKPVVRDFLEDGGPTGKKLNYYIAQIILEDIPGSLPGEPNVRAFYNVVAEVFSENEDDLYYEDRVKAGKGIELAKSFPAYQVLNPTQYPANPTLLEFRIDPLTPGQRKFDLNGIVKLKLSLDQNAGKFGPHIPLNTDFAMMTVDFSGLSNFRLPEDISAQVEGRDQRGGLQYGTGPATVRNWFKENRTITVIARDLPEDSSLLLVWGEPL